MHPIFKTRIFAISIILVLQLGCGTLSNNGRWGEEASLSPSRERIRKAALTAVLEPETWIPALGAAAFQMGDIDEDVSEWASDHTPVFGSQERAEQASHNLKGATAAAYLITAMIAPSGENPKEWTLAKLKGLGIGLAAVATTFGVTELIKNQTDRTRPDESDDDSFPSGHTSSASAFAALGTRNLRSLHLSPQNRKLLHAGFTALALGTGWARIEGKRHYPSDVLAGYAIGHFLGAFINDAFIGPDTNKEIALIVDPTGDYITLGIRWVY
jgi:hypothetical protein